MAITWGPWERNTRLGIDLRRDGGNPTMLFTADVWFESTVPVTDNTNTLHWNAPESGVASSKTPGMSQSGTGQKKIHTVTWTRERTYGTDHPTTFNAWITNIEWVPDGRLDASAQITMPARPYSAPRPPLGPALTRNSDTSHTLSWAANYDGINGAQPWITLHVERWDNVTGSWYEIAQLGWSATSHTDTTTVANREYDYRVRAKNPSGFSAYADVPSRYTSPGVPSGLSATKAVVDIVLTWTNTATMPHTVEVWESQDDGAYTLLHTTGPGATTWTHVGASNFVTHRYQVRARNELGGTVLYSAYSNGSELVALLAPPNAPTALDPNGAARDASEGVTAVWQHNPVDLTGQTHREVRHRLVGAGSWTTTGKVSSTGQSYPLPGLINGESYEWQVRTWGQHEDASPWSAIATFAASARPLATITTPADDTVWGGAALTVAWTYYDVEGTTQAGARVEVLDALGVVLHTSIINGPAHVLAVPFPLANFTAYQVRVTVRDGSGLWSTPTSHALTTDFVPPPTPVVAATFDSELGTVTVQITNPPPRVNLLPNPSFDVNTSGWLGNGSSIARVTDGPGGDGAVLRITPTGVNAYPAAVTGTILEPAPVPGESYTAGVTVWSQAGPNPRGVRLTLRFTTSGGTTITETSTPYAPDTMDGQRLTVSGVAPEGAEGVRLVLWHENLGSPMPVDRMSWWDRATLEYGATDGSWIDPSSVSAVHNALWRSIDGGPFVLIQDQLPLDTTVTDHVPGSHNRNVYQVVAWSVTPTSAIANETVDTASTWVFINGGPDFSQVARLKGGPSVGARIGRHKVLRQFVGRDYPVEFSGQARSSTFGVKGSVDGHGLTSMGSWQAWEAIADLPAPLLYRDPMGRRYLVSIGDVDIDHTAPSKYAGVSFAVTVVGR